MSLGTLAGWIAHDFNNILAAILGYVEPAQLKSQTDPYLNQYVTQILPAGLPAKDLVNQILTFSRQGRSEKGPRDISRVVSEALKLIKGTLPANIAILDNIPANPAPVIADEIQIHQIVMNLCTNAHHAMKATGGRQDVSLTPVNVPPQDARSSPGMHPGNYLKLSATDTGCGIPPAKAPASDSPPCTASSGIMAASSRWTAGWDAARHSTFFCRLPMQRSKLRRNRRHSTPRQRTHPL